MSLPDNLLCEWHVHRTALSFSCAISFLLLLFYKDKIGKKSEGFEVGNNNREAALIIPSATRSPKWFPSYIHNTKHSSSCFFFFSSSSPSSSSSSSSFPFLFSSPYPSAYGPYSLTISSFRMIAHADVSSAFFLHLFTPVGFRSFSPQSFHLTFGLPAFLLPSVFPRNTFFTVLSSNLLY